jgi:probable rRNA maturation factor
MRPRVFGTRDRLLVADVESLCRRLARGFDAGPVTVNVVFVNDRRIHELNRKFRRRDKPTDVLSFDSDATAVPGEPRLLGEVYVSRDRARAQAREYGATYREETRRLVLHGFLHLLGLTHKQMEPLYDRYLKP